MARRFPLKEFQMTDSEIQIEKAHRREARIGMGGTLAQANREADDWETDWELQLSMERIKDKAATNRRDYAMKKRHVVQPRMPHAD